MALRVWVRANESPAHSAHFSLRVSPEMIFLVENCYSTLKSALSLDSGAVGLEKHANRIPRGSRVFMYGGFIDAVRIEADRHRLRQYHDSTQKARRLQRRYQNRSSVSGLCCAASFFGLLARREASLDVNATSRIPTALQWRCALFFTVPSR